MKSKFLESIIAQIRKLLVFEYKLLSKYDF